MRLLVLAFLATFAFAARADYIKPLSTVPLVGPGTTGTKLPNGMTVGADIGAGPHKERDLTPAPRRDVDEIPAADHPTGNRDERGSASTGSSRSGDASVGSSGADNDAIERDEDRANRNKEKFKQRPGYRNDVPEPRASNGK
ncbi:MAG TPA: hypothetical protein VFB08_19470 [Burkholderiales bacterium]|nr:hypothetical protein [Burkholderiales bacterium]